MSDKPEAHTNPDPDGDPLPVTRPAARSGELSTSKVLAGGLAAATSAVLGSHFGASGTVGGAAVGSVVTTIGTNLYQRSLERARARVARQIPPKHPLASSDTSAPTISTGRVDQESTFAGSATTGPTVGLPYSMAHWIKVSLIAALAFFGLGLGLVTGFELAKGSPLSDSGSGTSLGHVLAPPATDQPSTPMPEPPQSSIPETSIPMPTTEPSPSSGPKHSGEDPSANQQPTSKDNVPSLPPVSLTPSAPLPRIGLPRG